MMMLHNAMEEQNYGSLLGEFASASGANSAWDQILREYRTVYQSYAPADARYLTLHKGHLMFVRPDEDSFATGDLIRAMTVSGTAPELRGRMRLNETLLPGARHRLRGVRQAGARDCGG